MKKVGASSMSVGSLKNAMAHVRLEGIEKKKDTEKKVIHLTVHLIYMYDYSFVLYTYHPYLLQIVFVCRNRRRIR